MSVLFSITLTLFFVIDALGNIPAYLHLLRNYNKHERRRIAVRELLCALSIMVIFYYLGRILLTLLNIESTTVQISGGIVLFLIAIKLIFSNDEEDTIHWKDQKPFIVPIATPMIAGPSVLSIIMIFAQEVAKAETVLGAIILAWLLSSILYILAKPIYNLFKYKGLNACQRLMGLIVAIIAVQLFLEGVLGALR